MDYSATKQMKCSSKYVFQLLGFQLLAILSVGGRSTVLSVTEKYWSRTDCFSTVRSIWINPLGQRYKTFLFPPLFIINKVCKTYKTVDNRLLYKIGSKMHY